MHVVLVPRKYPAMPKLVFTDLAINALRANGERVDYWDVKTPAFGIRVGKDRKTFIAKLNNRRIKIGNYPDLSLADARRKAMALKSDKNSGIAKPVKFSEALEKFYEVHVSRLKPRTQVRLKYGLDKHLKPKLDKKVLTAITPNDITEITDGLIKTPSEALHTFSYARIFFRWCVPRYMPHSPTEGLKPPSRYIPRKRVLADNEIKAVWCAAEQIGYPFGDMLRLLILTGQRWGEIASLRWSFINQRNKTITLPETKNGTEHTFPFGSLSAAIFASVPKRDGIDLLFPGRDDEEPWNGSGKAKWLLKNSCKIDDWMILDLRRTFATKLAELGTPPHIIERLLNHKLGSLQTAGVITAVAAVYNRHLYIDEMRAAVMEWEKRLREIIRRARLKRAA